MLLNVYIYFLWEVIIDGCSILLLSHHRRRRSRIVSSYVARVYWRMRLARLRLHCKAGGLPAHKNPEIFFSWSMIIG